MTTYDTSDRYALRALEGDNPVSDIDAGFAALRDDISAKLTPYDSGLLAARPVSTGGTPGKAGRIYRATDDLTGGPNGTLHVDYGTGWLPLLGVDATLTAIAAVTTAANKLIYATGSDTFATADLTAAGRALLDDADAAAQITTLGALAAPSVATPVRAIDTTYQPSATRPVLVTASLLLADTTSLQVDLLIENANPPTVARARVAPPSSGNVMVTLSGMVPAGWRYKLSKSGTGTVSVQMVTEYTL